MEIKSHPWFKGFPWEKLANKQLVAPFVPESTDNFDVKITNDGWKDDESEKMQEAALLLRRETVQDLFKGYYYDQSFENFGYNFEEKPLTTPIRIQQRKGPPHRSCKQSPTRNIINDQKRSTRSNSGTRRALTNIQNSIPPTQPKMTKAGI